MVYNKRTRSSDELFNIPDKVMLYSSSEFYSNHTKRAIQLLRFLFIFNFVFTF